eukprot:906019-Rhodomonas_salina.1
MQYRFKLFYNALQGCHLDQVADLMGIWKILEMFQSSRYSRNGSAMAAWSSSLPIQNTAAAENA